MNNDHKEDIGMTKRPKPRHRLLLLAGLAMGLVQGCGGSDTPAGTAATAASATSGLSLGTTTSPAPESASPLASSEVRKLTFHSESLNRDMRLSVYLPKGYSREERYPVLYLIHGYASNESSWMDDLEVPKTADRLAEEGKIRPLIVVAPEMDNSYGINSADTFRIDNPSDPLSTYWGRYEDYLAKDVLQYVDGHFSTKADRSGRYIGGISMGGFISLRTAFLHPDLFSRVGGHSPALFTDDWSTTGGERGLKAFLYPTQERREARDPLLLAPKLDLSGLTVYMDVGDEDDYKFYDGTAKMYDILKSKGVQAEYHLYPGKHNGEYWKPKLEEYLLFYDGK